MGSTTTTELGLDVFVKKMGGAGAGAAKMEDYVRRLEEERRKIDAFKRELPLCMLILTDVIAHVREELTAQCGDDEIGNESSRPAVVLEQFLPIRDDEEAEKTEKKKNSSRVEKMNWMSSVQLWSDAYSDEANSDTTQIDHHRRSNSDERIEGEPDRQSESSKSDGGGGFLLTLPSPAPAPALCSDLSLLTPGLRTSVSGEEHRSCGSSSQGVKAATATANVSPTSHAQSSSQQCPRKARRCWSPELHRRFLGALQQLGGSQAATPKQIRELMKIDGLTNDEVKSHLQKYRLHTRRVDQSMVVYGGGAGGGGGGGGGGGLWSSSSAPVMQQHRNSPSESSPQSPLHFKGGEEDDKSESFNWRVGKAHRASSNKECS